MANCFQLDIVSLEEEIYSGPAVKLFVTGVDGELEILYHHAPLLTKLIPGPVWVELANGSEEAFFISGGMLEVQPNSTSVLADTAIRATDVDEQAALEVKLATEKALQEAGGDKGGFDYQAAHSRLSTAAAQLRLIKKLRK